MIFLDRVTVGTDPLSRITIKYCRVLGMKVDHLLSNPTLLKVTQQHDVMDLNLNILLHAFVLPCIKLMMLKKKERNKKGVIKGLHSSKS